MTPQNRAQAPAEPRARGNTTQPHASPQRATCATPGCDRKHYTQGHCRYHYAQAQRDDQPTPPPTWRDELEQLATSNPTPTEYAQKAARIHQKRREWQRRIENTRQQRIAGNRS